MLADVFQQITPLSMEVNGNFAGAADPEQDPQERKGINVGPSLIVDVEFSAPHSNRHQRRQRRRQILSHMPP